MKIQMDWDLRGDGRKANELRSIKFETNFETDRKYNGSARVSQGLSECICLVEGPVKQSSRFSEERFSVLKLQCSQNATASHRSGTHIDKELTLILENVRETLEENICKDIYKNSEIRVDIVITQAHGSVAAVVLNCITLALADAGIEMQDLIVASHTGYLREFPDQPVMDLSSSEERSAAGSLLLGYSVAKSRLMLVEVQGAKLPVKSVLELTQTAVKGCEQIYKQMRAFLSRNYAIKSLLSTPM